MKALLVIPLVTLAACATPVVPVAPVPAVAKKESVSIDPRLLVKCQGLKAIEVRGYSKAETLRVIESFANQYTECAHRQNELVDLANKAFNTESKVSDSSK